LIHDVTFTRRYPSLSNNFIPVLLIVITAPVTTHTRSLKSRDQEKS